MDVGTERVSVYTKKVEKLALHDMMTLLYLNSSQSPRMTFMCLSKALNCPMKVLESWND